MNKTELYNWLADHNLSLRDGAYDMRFQGFTWVVTSLDGQMKYGTITLTNELIEREMPNIAAELHANVIGLMAKNHPEFFTRGAI